MVLLLSFLLLQGCRPVRESRPAAPSPPVTAEPVPTGYLRYRVVPAESEIRALVYRDGPMARLGHNHVVSSRGLTGDVFLGQRGEEPRFTLALPVATFSVDDAALRAEEGEEFPGPLPEDAIAGTRRNLLGVDLLESANHPDIRLVSRKISGTAPDYMVTMAVAVKGRSNELIVPVHVDQARDEVRATGRLTITHAQIGLTPFSVMGGMLSVRDEIDLRFIIVARRPPSR